MKVLLYFDKPEKIAKSGIGRALKHQCKALSLAGVEYTLDPKDNYDIAHINTYFPHAKKIYKKLLKRNVPIIMHGHSTIEDFKNSFRCWKIVAKLWYNKNLLWFYSHADHIITPTEYSKKCIDAYNLSTPVSFISNGINIDEYSPDSKKVVSFKEKFNIKDEAVVMGVGFPFNRKGIKDFIEIAKNRPDIKFIWFGHLAKILTTRDVLKAIKHAPKNVLFPGYIDSDIIKGCYQYAKCLMFTTYEETEGIVVLEALASHTPVLVRDIGVYDKWLVDQENCYKAKDNEEFLSKLDYLMNNDNKKIIKNGYKVAEEMTLEKIGQSLKSTYEKVIVEHNKK